jgi:hypothetical protein
LLVPIYEVPVKIEFYFFLFLSGHVMKHPPLILQRFFRRFPPVAMVFLDKGYIGFDTRTFLSADKYSFLDRSLIIAFIAALVFTIVCAIMR